MRESDQNGNETLARAHPCRRPATPCIRPTNGINLLPMADHHFESGGSEERVWDEYDWERFLQQQDRKTEKYMELLERYLDDPNRDQIIAREMGWHHLLDENGKDWTADLDVLFTGQSAQNGEADGEEDELEEDETEDEDEFEEDDEVEDDVDETESDEDEKVLNRHDNHPLYQAASALAVYVDGMFDEHDPAAQHPAVARLTTSSTLANVKLAAALSDDDVDEIGMTIAYLKRALKAVTNALDAATQCQQERLVAPADVQELRGRIFHVRDGIISLMGHYRGEWRRRYGRGR